MIRHFVNQSSLFAKQIRYQLRYSREFFENMNIDHAEIQRKKIQQQTKISKLQIFNVKSNDENQQNHIKNLRIDHQGYNHFDSMKQKSIVKQCAILTPQPFKTPVRFSATRKYISTTLKKATIAMKPIRKLYLYDAIARLQQSDKKVCKLMIPTLYNIVRHSIQKGLDPLRLFIHGVIIGKTMRFKGIRYHAKGKGGREQKDICQIKIIVEEKDQKQFYEQIGSGEAPSGFASIVRFRLVSINANYQQLQQMNGITTSKGRQQKRQLIKRRVYRKMKENSQNQTFVPQKTIVKQIRQEQGKKAKELFYSLKPKDQIPSIRRREQLYKKNMGIQ